ncbi:hypothetical protein EC973_007099 [Apophysomyces ossiformis]|uniref:Cullin family profile domain-containing protein n=1 Tax=Apophysomyces ossiformis TaxID=679940 RepID=A0A8H7BVJ6_9FUNG|nr:hypothetical protein EC973_007099 [Apophysomyces ossiformis]
MAVDKEPTENKENTDIDTTATLGTLQRASFADKLAIKNLREPHKDKLPEAYYEEAWQTHRRLLLMILHSEPLRISLQSAYELCENICRFDKAKDLYLRLESELKHHIQKMAVTLNDMASRQDDFLLYLNTTWAQFCEQMTTIRNVFMELDRRYIMRSTSYPSLIALGKDLFRNHVMESRAVRERLVSNILYLIRQERDGCMIDRELVRSLLNMTVDLELYSSDFEPRFMEDTIAYYSQEGSRLINELSVPEYLQHTYKRREEEGIDRMNGYLDPRTKAPLMEAVTEQLIYVKTQEIISKGFDAMMDEQLAEPLRIFYEALNPSKELAHLRAAFADYIKRRGTDMIKDPKQDAAMVPCLLDYKAKLDNILANCFHNDTLFANVLKESFETFVNTRRNRPAELVAKFIDSKLRASSKKTGDEDVEQVLDRVLVIFRYLQGKDTFEAFYKRFLAKRLLLNRSASNDAEKNMLAKLKAECGPDFTKNMEAMFKDIEISADLTNAFKASKEYKQDSEIQMHTNVLAQGIWPSYSMPETMLPADMITYQEAYERFYTAKFKGRRLTWKNSLGSCSIKAHFPSGTKELQVSVYQTAVLLLFNHKSVMPYKEIQSATALDEKELKRVLQSLACGQYKIIKKSSAGAEIKSSDEFTYNAEFTASPYRIKINTIQQEQTVEERKETQSKVLINRQHQLEAAIVRIMKAKRKLSHAELVKEIFAQLKFPLEASEIKKRIETLIDRDYLTRDEHDNSLYIYVS